ncbi:head-tail adaptor protein [Anoxybacillus ayderensis G10]|uniref:phage head closure protein n=1 Tax=Anoxybacillus sp. ST70 TaxID=2864180 RepID=UPI000373BA64|nr:phage head closure protein [Anoxybacillus sp. ST70]AXM88461.1 head-tail adaptor protein [Anoxybacillus ayderensis G10]MBW9219266.1 phage head closure protein [Anoxybacillus sp. ST70]
MNPGLFRHRITFQQYDENAVNENGFPLEDSQRWTDVKTVWAMIKTLQGREYYEAAATQNENTVRFVIRYTSGITPDMRIKYKDRAFEILSVINDDERNIILTIIAKEVM